MAARRPGAGMSTVDAFLGGSGLTFELGRQLHGAFGGAFGGVLAAAVLVAARSAAPDLVPAGLDCRFLRSLPAGTARAEVTTVHAGRTVTCVRVDLHDERGRLATTGTASFVDPRGLRPLDVAPTPMPAPERWQEWRTPAGVTAPIIELLRPRVGSVEPGVIATEVVVPWDDPGGTYSAEAACVAADLSVGPPVAAACAGTWSPHPNPDLSLRFTPADTGGTVVSVARVAAVAGGLASVALDLGFAVGAATSVVLAEEER